jgi:hypothetical protein
MKLETKIKALGLTIMISAAMPICVGLTLIATDLGWLYTSESDLFWHTLLTVFAIVTAYFLAVTCNILNQIIDAAAPDASESPLSSTYKELL